MSRGWAGGAAGEWLDRRPWLPVVLILLVPWIVHLPQWFLGLSTDPIWSEARLALSVHPGLIASRYNIDPAAGWNTEALGHLAAWDWVHGILPWWNPYCGIGIPLVGEMQPPAFFLPFNLLLLLPDGVLRLKTATQTVPGLGTYALLRPLGLGRLASLAGAALYLLNGTEAWFADALAFPAAPETTRTHSLHAWSYQKPGGLACPAETIRSSRTPGAITRSVTSSRADRRGRRASKFPWAGRGEGPMAGRGAISGWNIHRERGERNGDLEPAVLQPAAPRGHRFRAPRAPGSAPRARASTPDGRIAFGAIPPSRLRPASLTRETYDGGRPDGHARG
ncbi:MAG TPA: hypothetical protein VMF62_05040 [Acetobacteraceae bacterium]|nr:hypothetical protein [Acetobacteraceae bacterium]